MLRQTPAPLMQGIGTAEAGTRSVRGVYAVPSHRYSAQDSNLVNDRSTTNASLLVLYVKIYGRSRAKSSHVSHGICLLVGNEAIPRKLFLDPVAKAATLEVKAWGSIKPNSH